MPVWDASAEEIRAWRGQIEATGIFPPEVCAGIDPGLVDCWEKPRFLGPWPSPEEWGVDRSPGVRRLFRVPDDTPARAAIEAWIARCAASDVPLTQEIPSYVLVRDVERSGRRRGGAEDDTWRALLPCAETAQLRWDPAVGALRWVSQTFNDRATFERWLERVSGAPLESADRDGREGWCVVDDPYQPSAPRAARHRRLPVLASPPAEQASTQPSSGPELLNLSISAPCEQHCSFCTLHTDVPVSSEADARALQFFEKDIRAAGAAGTRVLRINGIEPLAASYLFDLLAIARASGFREYEVYSTCRPLADRALAARLVEALSPHFKITVPVYGSTAAVHDELVDAPGAFAAIRAAVANLRDLGTGERQIHFQTVVTRQNLHDLPAIAEYLRSFMGGDQSFPAQWSVHLPFPSGSDAEAAYRRVAVSMSEVLATLYAPGVSVAWNVIEDGEVPPCVMIRHQESTGQELFLPGGPAAQRLAGNRYVGSRVAKSTGGGSREHLGIDTMPCPHRASCAAGDSCRGEVYSLYAAQFGLGELRPVSAPYLAAIRRPAHRARQRARRAWFEFRHRASQALRRLPPLRSRP